VNGRRKSEDSELLASGLKVCPPLNDWGEGARRVRERSGAIRHGGWGVELRLYQTFCVDDANINQLVLSLWMRDSDWRVIQSHGCQSHGGHGMLGRCVNGVGESVRSSAILSASSSSAIWYHQHQHVAFPAQSHNCRPKLIILSQIGDTLPLPGIVLPPQAPP
jgi:hypothetical protein